MSSELQTDANFVVHIDPTLTLNELVAHYPAALPVLSHFGLDTCCGGALPLQTAAAHHALDLDTLLTALGTAIDKAER